MQPNPYQSMNYNIQQAYPQLKELHRQDGYYLDKIMKDQKEILKMLSDIKSDFAHSG